VLPMEYACLRVVDASLLLEILNVPLVEYISQFLLSTPWSDSFNINLGVAFIILILALNFPR
ncbi:hypothetical protein ABK046_50765, partial [Streptomyces caeruleatus]